MKQTFTKNMGRVTEKLELELEDKWIYAHYTKGSFEKTTCILKYKEKSQMEYLNSFFKETNVSEVMKKEVEKYLLALKDSNASAHWEEFTNFMLKTLSLHTALGISIAIAVYAGYLLGSKMDAALSVFPLFTLVGIFLGITIGVLTGYLMVKKYSESPADSQKTIGIPNSRSNQSEYPRINVTIDQVRKAVREFFDNLPKGAHRTILVQDDNQINFTQLAPILGGIPTKVFYMSKETYDIFEEKDKLIPIEMDIVQRAVDQYVKEHKEYPMLKFDPLHRVNYYQLLQEHYLKTTPNIPFYITDLDGLITHIKPIKKMGNSS